MGEKRFDILAIGNAVVDVLVHVSEDFVARHALVKGGMTLVSEDVAHKILSTVEESQQLGGGSVANTAVGVASMGGKASFVGRVCEDDLGASFAQSMRAAGVHFETPAVRHGAPTAHCLICVTPDAERSMQTFLGASIEISTQELQDDALADCKVVFLEGYLWTAPHGIAVLTHAAQKVRAAGGTVAFTLSDFNLVAQHRDGLIQFIKNHVDVLFANELEAGALSLKKDIAGHAAFLGALCSCVALTRSEKGSVVISKGAQSVIEARSAGGVVDTTGAGDLYAAGFLYGVAHGFDLERCGNCGAIAAEEIISHTGARPQVVLSDYVKNKLTHNG